MSDGEILDLRGLKCPLPALIARRHLERSKASGKIIVLSDDPMAPIDLAHMCAQEGYEVVTSERNADQSRLVLRRPG